MTKNKKISNDIAVNKKAKFDYEMKEEFIAGVQLQGWQVKALRAGRGSLANNPHVIIDRNGEAWIAGMIITPLLQASTHVDANPNASIKLLLNRKEIDRMIGQKEQKGYTIIVNKLFWQRNFIKAKISLAKGKNNSDKRSAIKDRESKIEADRAVKNARL